MSWENIIRKNIVTKQEVINFMNSLAKEILNKIEVKEGKKSFKLSHRPLQEYYYSPNYVLGFTPLVGYHEGEGFKPEMPDGDNKLESYVDWHDFWGYGSMKKIDNIADKFGEEYRLKEEDKEIYPVISYLAGSYDYENGTFQLYCKNEDAWAESLMTDVHRKIEEKFGKSDGKERYTPQYLIGISEETGEEVTAEQAIERDERATQQKDWRDSLQGKE